MADLELSYSRDFPMASDRAYELVLPMPLELIFDHGSGPISPVAGTSQQGTWGVVGQQRVIDLKGPGSMTETLAIVEAPTRFGYVISNLKGPFALLVSGVNGEWRFEPAGAAGDSVRITWSWVVHPKGALGRAAMSAFGYFWRGYAKRAFDSLGRELAQA